MSVSLQKGGNVSLTKVVPGLTTVRVGLGWDVNKGGGASYDLDAAAYVLNKEDKLPSDRWFVFFGNLQSPDGHVRHTGDNLTGEGKGDDEQIIVELSQLPAHIERVVLAVNIFRAAERGQHFGDVENAFIRIIDERSGKELARYELSDMPEGTVALFFGELYRREEEWKFRAVGEAPISAKTLHEIATIYS